jgi:tRNA(Ile)-lysidine synthetase-like protein
MNELCFEKKWKNYATHLGRHLPKKLWDRRVIALLSEKNEQNIGIACSGGLDSLCLLLVFYCHFPECKGIVLHYNHALREEESDGDEAFVHDVAASLGLAFFSAKRPPSTRCSEADLRKDRYAFFETILLQEEARYLLLGHHLDDVCESWMMNTARGASLGALVSPSAVQLMGTHERLRPFIHLERRHLEDAMKQVRVPWREDSSNCQKTYLRNRIRQDLMPLMDRFFSKRPWKMGWRHTWQQIKEVHEAVRFYADPFADLINHESPDFSTLKGHPWAMYRHILDAWLVQHHLRECVCRTNFEKFLDALVSGSDFSCSIDGRMVLQIKAHRLTLVEKFPHSFESYAILWDLPRIKIFSGILKKSLCPWNERERKHPLHENSLGVKTDLSEDQQLLVRNWYPGDAYRPFGFYGRKKLKKMFQERGVSLDKRRKLPVIVLPKSGKIIWVPFLPLCEDFRVPPNSVSAVELTFHEI